MCLWWWWSWATLFSWPKTDVSNTRLVPYSSFTPPQACVSGGQPEGSGEDLRIKLVIQHCCLWWWDCTGLRVGGLQPDVVLLRSMLRSAAGLAGFIALHTLQFLVSWHWDGNLNSLADWTSSPLKTRPPPRSSPFAPLQPSVTTLSLCGAEWVPFIPAEFMTLLLQTGGLDMYLHQRRSHILLSPLVSCGLVCLEELIISS